MKLNNIRQQLVIIVCFFVAAFSAPVQAETIEKEGYVIHYSAFNASFITEEVAKRLEQSTDIQQTYLEVDVKGRSKPIKILKIA